MTTQQLDCFIRVADKLNFTKAAQEMFLSTPTVTHHIKSLEEELGAALFIRTSKMVQLTEAGSEFYGDAKDILNRINLSCKKISNAVSQSLSYIKIGCTSNAEFELLAPALSIIKKEFPDVYPMIFTRDYSRLTAMFENGHVDIMLVSKDMINNLNCTFKPAKPMESYAIVAPDSPFAKKESISFEELKQECLITLNPRLIPFTKGNTLQEQLALYSQSSFHMTCESERSALLLAKCGYGIAILPEFCIPALHNDLCKIKIKEQKKIDYGVAFNKNNNSVYIKKIGGIIKDVIAASL